MLKKLKIRNYALIESLDLDLNTGMTAMTGETGSGKSIVLGALGLLLGHRSESSALRNSTDRCTVEGIFTPPRSAQDWLAANELDVWEELIIRREITPQGRSRAFINDTPVKAHDLQALGGLLVDLHGQDGTRLLLQREYQLAWIDTHAQNMEHLAAYQQSFREFVLAQSDLAKLELERSKPQTDLDYIHYQLRELESLELRSKDWDALLTEKELLENSTDIRTTLHEAWSALAEGASDSSPLERLQWSLKSLSKVTSMSRLYESLQARLQSVTIELQDIADEMESQSDAIESNPQRLAQLEAWHNELQRILHKHNAPDAKTLMALETSLQASIEAASNIDAAHSQAQEHLDTCRKRTLKLGHELMERRVLAAKQLSTQIEGALQLLSIPKARLDFDWNLAPEPDAWGIEELQVLFSANPGQPPLPLQKVASGGEKSRLMLAIKATGQATQPIPVIVLDEIDTGVSGRVAEEMAKLMATMAEQQQVISVTHLPQVAALAAHHIRVSKSSNDSTTSTDVQLLSSAERIQEIAAMLSGSEISEAAITNAQALLKSH